MIPFCSNLTICSKEFHRNRSFNFSWNFYWIWKDLERLDESESFLIFKNVFKTERKWKFNSYQFKNSNFFYSLYYLENLVKAFLDRGMLHWNFNKALRKLFHSLSLSLSTILCRNKERTCRNSLEPPQLINLQKQMRNR